MVIHDITTDTENPPTFVALLAVRNACRNGSAYGGARVAAEQRVRYPDIQPLLLTTAPAAAFQNAWNAARAMNWAIAAAAEKEGRIEATATTRVLRFKDDVIIRITPHDSSTRVDVRSVSRLGRNDFGTNAKRIRRFFDSLKNPLKSNT